MDNLQKSQKDSAKKVQGRCKGGAREMLKLYVKFALEMLKVNICEKQWLISGHSKKQVLKTSASLRQQTEGR